jgi:large subunit ribosomal protein L7e
MSELKAKKVARDTKLAADATKAKAEADKANAKLVTDITEKAKKYEAEYAALEKQAIDNRRKAKANNEIYVAPEDKVVFVIRVRGIIGISPKTKKILQLLRLRQIHNGVFVRVNAATTKMLRLIEPFIAYGHPNLKSVKELIYKRGFGKVNGQRIPISSNTVVQAGVPGMQCIEDIIHEIYTCGPRFKEAS